MPPMAEGRSTRDGLDRVLVLTARKGFWASAEAERFPHRVETPVAFGHSTGLVNTLLLALRALPALVRLRPRVLVTGSAHRLVPVLLVLRRLRLLRARLVVTNQVFFGPRWGRHADCVIVYSRRETEGRPTYRYVPIPADGDFDAVVPRDEEVPYAFTGGAALRDFRSVVEAVQGTGLRLVIVTDGPETLGIEGPLPDGCEVLWRMGLQEFLGWMAGALCVVVPLNPGDAPHGHTTVAQALCLGRAVVTTAGASVDDYVRDGVEGRLVEAGDVTGYRAALLEVTGDPALRARFEDAARARAPEFSYPAFADELEAICRELQGLPPQRETL